MSMVRASTVLVLCLILGPAIAGGDGWTPFHEGGGWLPEYQQRAGAEPETHHQKILTGNPSAGTMARLGDHTASDGWNESTLKGFSAPFGVVFDPVNGDVYVSDYGSNNVSVIDPSTNQILAYVPLGGPFYGGGNLVCDPVTGNVYAGSGSEVLVISGETNTVVATIPITIAGGALPEPMTYDAQTRDVFILDGDGTNISVVNQTSLLYTVALPGQYADGAVYDSSNEEVYATSFSFPSCSGTCNVNWDHVSIINGSTAAVTPTAFTMVAEFRMIYVPAFGEIFDAGVDGNFSVFDPQNGQTLAILNLSADLGGVAYDSKNGLVYVTNRQFGNPYNGSSITPGNNVTIIDPETERSVGSIPVWSQPVGIAYDDLTNELFVANMGSGSVSVVDLNPPTYGVHFAESGLPTGTNWSVSVGGSSLYSTGSALATRLPNGTYPFSVRSVAGYTATPTSGTISVAGQWVLVRVNFTAIPSSTPVYLLVLAAVSATAVVLLLAVWLLVVSRKRRRSPPEVARSKGEEQEEAKSPPAPLSSHSGGSSSSEPESGGLPPRSGEEGRDKPKSSVESGAPEVELGIG